VALVGLLLMLLGVSTGLWLGIAGAVLTTAGLRMMIGAIQLRWVSGGTPAD
jgi:hypothetical protein